MSPIKFALWLLIAVMWATDLVFAWSLLTLVSWEGVSLWAVIGIAVSMASFTLACVAATVLAHFTAKALPEHL